MEQNYTYSAFICSMRRSPDRDVAVELEKQLESCTVPKAFRGRPELTCVDGKRLRRICSELNDQPLSEDTRERTETALRESEWLLVICTPDLLKDLILMQEVEYFISLGRKDHIIPVLVEGTPDTAFPPQLLWDTDEQGRVIAKEPLAVNAQGADMAERKKRLKTEKLRIVAKMLNVGFDDLRQRAKTAQMKLLLTAGLSLTALAAGITVYTLIQAGRVARERDIAEAQRTSAEEQRTLAEEQRSLAEEQKGIAEEQRDLAEEQRSIAEEQRALAEQERHDAVVSNINMLLEKSLTSVAAGDRLQGIRFALDAEDQSQIIDGECREEIRTTLQSAVYINAFSKLIRVKNDNRLIKKMAASPDGRYLAGMTNINAIAMVSGLTGEILYTVCDSDEIVISPAFSPDGSRFLSIGDLGKHVSVWDTVTGELLFRGESEAGEKAWITTAMFWGDSDTLLLMDGKTVCRVTVSTGARQEIYTVGTHDLHFDPTEDIYHSIVGPEAKVAYDEDAFTYEADVNNGRNAFRSDMPVGIPLALSPDGTKILVGGVDATDGVCIINGDGSLYSVLQYMPGMLTDEYTFSPDGALVSVSAGACFFATWDVPTGELLYVYTINAGEQKSNIVYTADSKALAIVLEKELYVIDARTSECTWVVTLNDREGTSWVPRLRMTADGRYLILTDGDLYILDMEKQRSEYMCQIDTDKSISNAVPLQGNTGVLVSDSDGNTYVISLPLTSNTHEEASYDGALVPIRDFRRSPEDGGFSMVGCHTVSDGFKDTSLYGDLPSTVFFSPDGKYGALVHADGAAEIYHRDRGSDPVYLFSEHINSGISEVAFTGNIMISLGRDNRISLYDLEKGETVRVYTHDTGVNGIHYNARTEETAQVYAHDARADGIALSADGTMFMASFYNQTFFMVYNIALDEPLFTMDCDEPCTSFGFAADGSAAVVLWEGGSLVGDLYPDYEELLQRARELTGRE